DLVIPLIPSHRWRNPEPPPTAGSDPAPSADPAPTAASPAPSADPTPSVEAQAGPQDYAAVPVQAFGLAMLRGMGWRQGEGIGRTFKRVVKPLEQRLRPRGLGLGADPAPPGAPRPPRGGVGEDPNGGGLKVGAVVCIEAGPHRDMVGKVEGLEPETGRAVVRLELGGQAVTVNQYSLRTPFPLTELCGVLMCVPPRAVKQIRGAPPGPPPWLRRDLRVRCIDRGFQAGRYYNCKMVVEDMVTPDTCVCRTDQGLLVEGLTEAMLETVIPRGDSDRVLVVLGEHRGKVRMCRSQALVQLLRDEAAGHVVPLDYDAICHYVGGHEDD
uniref:G-patch domain and KOW motifs-containing protein n=1 Tax=Melopsittacus undulatus TaxID=13146 RepID=A0A8V5GT23_MELUD